VLLLILVPLFALVVFWRSTGEQMAYDGLETRGLGAVMAGHPDQALRPFTEMVELDPSQYLGYWDRAAVEARIGRERRAIADYSAALKILSTPDGALQLTRAFDDHVVAGYRLRAVRASLHYNRPIIEDRIGLVDAALTDCSTCLEEMPNSDMPLRLRADEYLRKGDVADAVADADALIDIRPGDPWRFKFRAAIEDAEGRHDLAVRDNRRADALAPTWREGYRGQ
jgi:tetratricopeptide (TPR) repeat protein